MTIPRPDDKTKEAGGFAPRLWVPSDDDGRQAAPLEAAAPDVPLGPQMTLTQFFERWYLPNVMRRQKRNDADTVEQYRKSLFYWRQLTGDPSLASIDEVTLYDKFAEGLRHVTYRRGAAGVERPMSAQTATKHMRNIRAVYFRTGPKVDNKRPSKALVPEITHLVITTPEAPHAKARFSVAQARLVFAACDQMVNYGAAGSTLCRRGDGGPGADDRWRAFLAQCYYGGHRFEAYQGITWRMLVQIEGLSIWDIPPGIIKGKKFGVRKYVHSHALDLLRRLPRTPGDDDELVFPWLSAHSHSHILARHYWLQRQAGTRTAIDLHGWRRTHTQEIYRLGLGAAVELARKAAAHGHARTTREHYLEVEPAVIELLPPLDRNWFNLPGDHPDQRRLF